MKKMVRCKACGHVMVEAKVGEVCPACGLPKTVFESYEEKIAASRKKIIDLHLHPIAVHFPQALASLIALALIAEMIFDLPGCPEFLGAAKWMSILLPLAVAASLATGLFDGKVRFKKLATPFLLRKLLVGSMLLLLSLAMAILVLTLGVEQSAYYLLALSVACIICQIVLGETGSRLMYAMLKG